MNVFEKIDKVKELIETTLPNKKDKEIYDMVRHIARFKDGIRKKPLSEQEKILGDLLLRNNYNPRTVYKWFRVLFFYPPELQAELKVGKISFRRAIRKKTELTRAEIKTDSAIMNDIHSDILRLVEEMKDV